MTPDFQGKKLIVIAGPTATGKSLLSVELSKVIGGEVISADSVQVYRGMDIGSAKIMREEMQGIRHHLISVIDIDTDYSVFMFQQMAKKALLAIYERNAIPILCGGTGFYIQSLIYDIKFEKADIAKTSHRKELEEIKSKEGFYALQKMLKDLDPYTYERIDVNNPKRVLRALEFFKLYGYSISKHNEKEARKRENSPFDLKFFVLFLDRSLLYERIDRRVDLMIENGFLDEVIKLKEAGLSLDKTAGEAIGYRELLLFLDGKISFDQAVNLIKLNTRHFAKRQITWFKREKKAHWINIEKEDALYEIRKYL